MLRLMKGKIKLIKTTRMESHLFMRKLSFAVVYISR